MDGIISAAMVDDHPAGLSLSIVQNGKIALLKGYGVSSLDPLRPFDPQHTLSRIGSISKTFTWILLMKEVERGRIRLDDPVNDYLPDALKIPDQGFRNPIRFVHLMSHSPGFEDSTFGHLIVGKPDDIMPTAQYLARHRPDRVREPGTRSSYSNYGVALAGYIAGRLNGVDFQTLAEREIFEPLGMEHTTFREPYPSRADLPAPMRADLADDIARAVSWSDGHFREKHPLNEFITQVAPAGSVWTTAEDMARYMLLQLSGGTLGQASIYSSTTAQAFRTPITEDAATPTHWWAHGFVIETLPGNFKAYGHSGGTISYAGYMVVVPQLDLGVFSMTNTSVAGLFSVRLPSLIVEHFYAPAASLQQPGDPVLAQQASHYAGQYLSARRAYSGLEGFVGLVGGGSQVSVTSDGYLVTGGGPFRRAWVPAGPPGHFRAASGNDAEMVFELDSSGRALNYTALSGFNERAGWLLNPLLLKVLAALVSVTSLATWVTALVRIRREVGATVWQRRSKLGLLAAAALWLVAFATFAVSMSSASETTLMFGFPTPGLIMASTAALIATLCCAGLIALLPLVWRGQSPQEASWTGMQKSLYTCAVVLFAAFGGLVGYMGGLLPWR